ncbi:hypothetical protein Patl1_15508 [Pistacia atlantica]|uniref:Uncharacterized protein n=1 Tax=Pistacia atlantica TaxID=434234 RepID=A0ACC1B9S0_9ROSI|nr:hypothetical protein Patl1_15508 [Pistacia atlantica]
MASSALSSKTKKEEVERFVPNEHDFLQRHVAFFDRNHDGIVYPWETFQDQSVAAYSCPPLVPFSSTWHSGKCPNLLFPIEVKNIHKAKHGSDSGVYDSEGRFVPVKFEEIFSKHAHTHHNALTSDELMAMLKFNREPKDYKGWVASYTEWKILYYLCKDKHGLLDKDTVRAVYDGSLFERMEMERQSANKKA